MCPLVSDHISDTSNGRILLIFGQKLDIDKWKKIQSRIIQKKSGSSNNYEYVHFSMVFRPFLKNYANDFAQIVRNGRKYC